MEDNLNLNFKIGDRVRFKNKSFISPVFRNKRGIIEEINDTIPPFETVKIILVDSINKYYYKCRIMSAYYNNIELFPGINCPKYLKETII